MLYDRMLPASYSDRFFPFIYGRLQVQGCPIASYLKPPKDENIREIQYFYLDFKELTPQLTTKQIKKFSAACSLAKTLWPKRKNHTWPGEGRVSSQVSTHVYSERTLSYDTTTMRYKHCFFLSFFYLLLFFQQSSCCQSELTYRAAVLTCYLFGIVWYICRWKNKTRSVCRQAFFHINNNLQGEPELVERISSHWFWFN